MSQVKLIVSNWKMNLNISQARTLIKKLKKIKIKKNLIKNIICPQFILLPIISNIIKDSNILLGAQDCHYKKFGAYTGDTSIELIKEIGCKYVIIGHSEVRKAGENNRLINLKIKNSLSSGLKVIFCIGETLKEKRKKITKKVLNKQIKLGLNRIKNNKNILIAYEPVWSIGTGLIPESKELFDTIRFIKKVKKNNKVLYGGSVNPKNINQLKSITNIDGYLIGGASQDSKKFIDIIKKTYN